MKQANVLRILQIGAGSMGSRRLRDLSQCAEVELALYDPRTDRLERAATAHRNFAMFADWNQAVGWQPDALCISTPPDQHARYRTFAVEHGLHHFCEAGIWNRDVQDVEQAARASRLVCAPSCSFHFLPIVRELKRVVAEELGTLHGYQMALNTYMPDWHPGEGAEYYARHRATAAGREMVPFELLWLNEVFGPARSACGTVSCGGSLPGVVEDTWSLNLSLARGSAVGQLMVLMASPGVLRRGLCFGDAGQVGFDVLTGELRREFRGKTADVRQFGAQADVLEETYRQEIWGFVAAIRESRAWPMTYRDAAFATATLGAVEQAARTGHRVLIDVASQPLDYVDGNLDACASVVSVT